MNIDNSTLKMLIEVCKTLEYKKGLKAKLNDNHDLLILTTDGNEEVNIDKNYIMYLYKKCNDIASVVEAICLQLNEVKANAKIYELDWEIVRDLIIIVPQPSKSDFIENCVCASKCEIPLKKYGLKSLYAINLNAQLIFLTNSIFDNWEINEEDLYDVAMSNMKRLLKFKSLVIEAKELSYVFKYEVAVSEDVAITCSALYLLNVEELMKKYPTGFIISVPAREFLFVAELNEKNSMMISDMTQEIYHKKSRYNKLQYPILFNGSEWGATIGFSKNDSEVH